MSYNIKNFIHRRKDPSADYYQITGADTNLLSSSLDYEFNGELAIVGPWYLATGYLNIVNAWNLVLGSGVTISVQDGVDYGHLQYSTGETFSVAQYQTDFGHIESGNHGSFILSTGRVTPLSDTGTRNTIGKTCFWYANTGDNNYSLPTGGGATQVGCLYNGSGLKELNPTASSCWAAYFQGQGGAETCLSGVYEDSWDGDVPTAFSPFSRGGTVASVINGAITPGEFSLTGWNTLAGIAPKSKLLLGINNTINENTSEGAFIRINPSLTRLTHVTGINVIEPAGNNYNVLEPRSNNFILSVGHCRWIGNSNLINNFRDTHVTGNYGYYSGRGRASGMMFSFPSDRVWAGRHWMEVGTGLDTGSRFVYTSSHTYVEDDSYLSVGLAAGSIALIKQYNTGWKFEDCVTSLYQSCRQYGFKTVPRDSGQFAPSGSPFMGGNVYLGHTGIGVNGDILTVAQHTGGIGSTNWFYAFPSGNSSNIRGSSFSVIQFGTGLGDPTYEQILYQEKAQTATATKDLLTYPTGTLFTLTRGYNNTTGIAHASGENIYTPLLSYSGWNEYVGWGIPDVYKAIIVPTGSLKIMPPWSLTGLYSNGTATLVTAPFRSTNYSYIQVNRRTDTFPLGINDGTPVFLSSDSGTIITGYERFLPSGNIYYTAFQVSKNKTYVSEPADYASIIIKSTGWNWKDSASSSGVSIKFATYENASGYILEVMTGVSSVQINTKQLGLSNSVLWLNTSGYDDVELGIAAYTIGGTLIDSSSKSYALTGTERVAKPSDTRNNRTIDLKFKILPDYSSLLSNRVTYGGTGLDATVLGDFETYPSTNPINDPIILTVITGENLFNDFYDTISITRDKNYTGKPVLIYSAVSDSPLTNGEINTFEDITYGDTISIRRRMIISGQQYKMIVVR